MNTITASVADLNHRIDILKASGDGTHAPNDLLDKRDQLITDLSKLVRTQVVKQDDGSYNVFLGSGHPLVVKDGANKLVVIAGDSDPRKMQVALRGTSSTLKLGTNGLLQSQSWGAQSSASHLQSYAEQINRIDSILADPSVGLSPALSSFFAGVHDVATNPSDTASRQGMLSQAQTVTARFHQLDEQFEAQRNDANGGMAARRIGA